MSHKIIIPTAGRPQKLLKCLKSIALNCGEANCVVVDNNQDFRYSDETKSIVRRFPGFEYIRCESPGLTAARHMALSKVDASILIFLDDDVTVTPGWLGSILKAFEDSRVAIAGGPSLPTFEGSVPAWFWDFLRPTPYGGWSCGWLSLLDIGKDIEDINPRWIWGLNFAIRREILEECGGFHVDLVPSSYIRWQGDGETGLTLKLAAKGCKAVYRNNSLVFHHCGPDRLNLQYFAKRAYYQGICNSYTELRRKLIGNEFQEFSGSQINSLKRLFRYSVKSFRSILLVALRSREPNSLWGSDAAKIYKQCNKAEQDGYQYHQREAASDPVLREWICRKNYFDVDLRDLPSD